MKLYTIGFTQSSAEGFFSRLKDAGVKRVLDTRLNNVSQLAGFAKKEDLAYFSRAIVGADYAHLTLLAPSEALLDGFKKKQTMRWTQFERKYRALLASREVEAKLRPEDLAGGCLLCSEATPEHCHRRLAAEYLAEKWPGVTIEHL